MADLNGFIARGQSGREYYCYARSLMHAEAKGRGVLGERVVMVREATEPPVREKRGIGSRLLGWFLFGRRA